LIAITRATRGLRRAARPSAIAPPIDSPTTTVPASWHTSSSASAMSVK